MMRSRPHLTAVTAVLAVVVAVLIAGALQQACARPLLPPGATPERVLATYGLQVVRAADAAQTEVDRLFESQVLSAAEAIAATDAVKRVGVQGERLEVLLRTLADVRGVERQRTSEEIAAVVAELLEGAQALPLQPAAAAARDRLLARAKPIVTLGLQILAALEPVPVSTVALAGGQP